MTQILQKDIIGKTVNEVEIAVNSDLENLRKWLMANKLSLNVTKTEFIRIGSNQLLKQISDHQPNITIKDQPIKQVSESKTFGVIVDQHLKWKSNTENICKKLTSGLYALWRWREFANQKTLLSVYNAIV